MKKFDELYQELLKLHNNELAEVLEEVKKEKKKLNKIILILCVIIDVTIFKYFIFPYSQLIKLNFGLSMTTILPTILGMGVVDVLAYVLIHGIFGKKQREYKQQYKKILIERIINNFYTDLEYFPQKEMHQYIYDEVKYNEYYNRYNSEDYFEAKINGEYSVQIAEIVTKKVETRRTPDGSTHTTTTEIFNGLFAKIEIDKSINSELKIMQNGKMFFDSKRLKMDSSEFEKYFDVKATNQIIGMQILTADVMEELINFQDQTHIKYDISIINNNLYLRFHCGGIFEPKNIGRGELDNKSLEEYFGILNFTYNLSNKLIKLIKETEF